MATTNTPSLAHTERQGGPGLLIGGLVGLMITIPLAAIFYLAEAMFGLPFVPFDMLDWMARNLPGGLLTFGIDSMVRIITGFNLGETSSAAKTAEHILGISGMIITGMVAVAIYFWVMNRSERQDNIPASGLVLGLAVGVPVAIISNSVNFTAAASPLVSAIWIVVAYLGWGAAAAWAYEMLYVTSETVIEASTEGVDRRSFLIRMGGATATITLVGAGLGAFLHPNLEPESGEPLAATIPDEQAQGMQLGELPNADAEVEPAPGTRPEYTPVADHYRIDISARPPEINGANYVLPITGLVDHPLELTLDDIRAYESMDQYVTLACISNYVGGDLTSTTKWTGVSLQQILAELGVQENAQYLRIFSADGFDETLSLALIHDDERIMLAYDWDNNPLPIRNGYPLRVYIPDLYGMKQPKWITEIQVVEDYAEGYWVRRGWDEIAQMKATSVVDTVATDAIVRRDGQFSVPVGGIAHAGARGISKVEVQVDDGEWEEAALRTPLSETTWVIWRFDWLFTEGNHTFRVRTYDGNSTLQTAQSNPPHPSGATGIHSRTARL